MESLAGLCRQHRVVYSAETERGHADAVPKPARIDVREPTSD